MTNTLKLNIMDNVKKLKRVVLKEELFSLTGDTIEAIILGQLLYWSERVRDFDIFIKEENNRRASIGLESNIEPQNGWFYKTAKGIADECMLNMSEVSVRRYLQKLISSGFISQRSNPAYKWDKTLQYRVNLVYIITELKKKGYNGLSVYKVSMLQNEVAGIQNEAAIPENIYRDYNINIKEEKDKSFSKKDCHEKYHF